MVSQGCSFFIYINGFLNNFNLHTNIIYIINMKAFCVKKRVFGYYSEFGEGKEIFSILNCNHFHNDCLTAVKAVPHLKVT